MKKLFCSTNGCMLFIFHNQDNFHIQEISHIPEILHILENILIMSFFCTLSKLQYTSMIGRIKKIYCQAYNIYAYGLH